MSIFCKHKWKIITKTFSEPLRQGRYWDTEDCMKLQNGMTTVLLKCRKCGRLDVTKMIGREVKEDKDGSK